MAIPKGQGILSVGEDVAKRELWCLVGAFYKGKSMRIPENKPAELKR